MVRLGRRNDGGYVLSQKMADSITTVLSFGISEDWSFEADIRKRNPAAVIHAYDHTVSHAIYLSRWNAWLSSAARFHISLKSLFQLYNLPRRYLEFFRGEVKHFEERVAAAREQPNDATIDDIFARIAPRGNIFVKMDIEGSEYDVMPQILQHSRDIIGLAVEFHDIGTRRQVFIETVTNVMQDFEITHLHANNYAAPCSDGFPESIEVTFEKRQDATYKRLRTELPIALDQPNKKKKPDYVLRFDNPA